MKVISKPHRRTIKRTNSPKFTDLFSGAGLFASSFVHEGFEFVDGVELDSTAIKTHHRNLGHVGRCGDVRQLEPIRDSDVIIAGPPCQGYSTLGKRDLADPRNALSMQVVRWASLIRPKIIVIENVPQFVMSLQFVTVAARLERMGYEIAHQILNASDFGVAQTRTRSFTFATLGKMPRVQEPKNGKTVRQAFAGLAPVPDGINNHYAPKPSELALERIRLIPAGGDKRDIMRLAPHLAPPSWWDTPSEATDVWGRMAWDEPANTLRTKFTHPSNGRCLHPEQHRVISLREGARLHSVPDSWHFEGSPMSIAKQIGNSVPFNLGCAVARAVREAL